MTGSIIQTVYGRVENTTATINLTLPYVPLGQVWLLAAGYMANAPTFTAAATPLLLPVTDNQFQYVAAWTFPASAFAASQTLTIANLTDSVNFVLMEVAGVGLPSVVHAGYSTAATIQIAATPANSGDLQLSLLMEANGSVLAPSAGTVLHNFFPISEANRGATLVQAPPGASYSVGVGAGGDTKLNTPVSLTITAAALPVVVIPGKAAIIQSVFGQAGGTPTNLTLTMGKAASAGSTFVAMVFCAAFPGPTARPNVNNTLSITANGGTRINSQLYFAGGQSATVGWYWLNFPSGYIPVFSVTATNGMPTDALVAIYEISNVQYVLPTTYFGVSPIPAMPKYPNGLTIALQGSTQQQNQQSGVYTLPLIDPNAHNFNAGFLTNGFATPMGDNLPLNYTYSGYILTDTCNILQIQGTPTPAPLNVVSRNPFVFMAEVSVYNPALPVTLGVNSYGHGTHARGVLPGPRYSSTLYIETLRASDVGYRTSASDPQGIVVYPPRLSSAFAIDTKLNLDPSVAGSAASWGSMTFSNAQGYYDAYVPTRNVAGRMVRVLAARKTFDTVRDITLDPPYSAAAPVFAGIADQWQLDQTSLTIPLRDATLYIERPIQQNLFAGTGGLEGTADLAGKPKPKARGGTAAAPIRNVSPVLIDPVNLVYQWTDAGGQLVTYYEGGNSANVTFAGDYADITLQGAPAGQYITCAAKGYFKLGTKPVFAVTCDVTGFCPQSGAISTVFALARCLLVEDAQLPLSYVDVAQFSVLDLAFPYVAGLYLSDVTTGEEAVAAMLAGAAAQLVPMRSGMLRPFLIRTPLPTSTLTDFSFSPDTIVSITPSALPQNLDPPTYRWRVGYARNYTIQATKDLNVNATAAQQTFVVAQDRYAFWASTTVLAQYLQASDPLPVAGSLLRLADAQALANALGAMWGVRRRVYLVEVPMVIGIILEVGMLGILKFPMDDLSSGQPAQVVGMQLRSETATVIFTVLV